MPEAFADWSGWKRVREADDERFNDGHRERLAAAESAATVGLRATCGVCGADGVFAIDRHIVPFDDAHREQLVCRACRLPARVRAAFTVLGREAFDDHARVYLTEHGSPAWRALRRRFPRLAASEFEPGRRPWWRTAWNRLRNGAAPHQDLRALTFPDAGFDAVVCLDVLEHIEAVDRALAEIARVLRPGGVLVATMPFDEKAMDDVLLATLRADGTLAWHGAEDWHLDPLGGRVPCFHRFGWALLDRARAAGFAHAHWCRVHAPEGALFGLWVLRAQR